MAVLSKILVPEHKHELQLVDNQEPYECNACKELGLITCYTCAEPTCNYHLHEFCGRQREVEYHRFLKKSTLILVKTCLGGSCNACGMPVRGYVYHCSKYRYVLHPSCLNTKDVLHLDGEAMKLELKEKLPSKCNYCGMKKLAGKITTWGYVSTCRNYALHISCALEILHQIWRKTDGEGTSGDGGREVARVRPIINQLLICKTKGRHVTKIYSEMKRLAREVKLIIAIVMAAVMGDNSAMALKIITNFIPE